MRPNLAPQTQSSLPRRARQAPAAAVTAVALTLAAAAPPEYPGALYDRLHLKPVTDTSSARTAPVATAFASASSHYERQIIARLAELRAAAHEDHIPWSQESADAAVDFLAFFPQTHRPLIVLTDAGTIAVVWDGGRDRQITLLFLAPDLVQYTLLSRRPGAHARSYSGGRDTPGGTLHHIDAIGLMDLLLA